MGMSAGAKPKAHSPETAFAIDTEVRKIIDDCYAEAKTLLTDNIDKLHTMADALMEFETLSAEQLDDIMAGGKPRHPTEPPSGSGFDKSDTEQGSPIGGPAEET